MKRLIEFPLEEGGSILVEVETEAPKGMEPAALGRKGIPEQAEQTFEQALEKLKPAASAILEKVRGLHDAPDEVEVEFGLRMDAKAGAVLAVAGIEANYKVTLTWK